MDSAKKTTHPAASARSPRPERGSFTPSSPAASSAEASTVKAKKERRMRWSGPLRMAGKKKTSSAQTLMMTR